MKRLAVIITAAGAAIISAVVLVSGSGAQQPGPPTGTLELVQLDRETRFRFIDNPPRRQEGPGDLIVLNGGVRDSSNRPTGRVAASFVATPARQFVGQGSGTFILGNGQIVVAGAIDDRGRSDTLAIVGGSGAYTGARGTVVTKETRRTTEFVFTFAG